MPDAINRRCPQCGRKAHDRLLVQCPDCRVPFVLDEPAAPVALTAEAIRLLAAQIFGSWKFWAVLLLLVGGATWAVVAIADRIIDARAKTYLGTLAEQATNHIGTVSTQISNQIAQEFRQPRIKAAIEQTARDKAAEIITNGVRPSLEAFQDAMDVAANQLAYSTNVIAQLQRDALAAQRKIPPPVVQTDPQTNLPAPVAVVPPSKPAPSNVNPTPAASVVPIKLSLANHTVLPAGNGYLLTLFFKTTNGNSTGAADLMAGTFRQTAKILNFSTMSANPSNPPTLSPNGDAAELHFNVTPNEPPTVVLELSAATIVRVTGDSLDTDLTLPVAADRMQIPSANQK